MNKRSSANYDISALFQLQYDFFSHFLVDVTVAAEGAGVLDVAGDLGDEVGVLDLFV